MNALLAPSVLALYFSTHDLWVMFAGVLCGVACAIPGCFLVLRRMSMLGDAISHSVLPGIAVAFFFSGSRDILPMLLGAAAAGLLASVLSSGLRRWGNVPEDASLGIVFTSMFALGVILINFMPAEVDLDPTCVLYGNIEQSPLDLTSTLGVTIPRAVQTISMALFATLILLGLFYKELKLVSFDAPLAASMGFAVSIVNYALMAVVAGTTVACFEAVGSILVVSMLIAPGATAHLLTDRLPRMIALSAFLAVTAAVIGYQLACVLNTSVAGMMSVVAGVQFALAVVFAPHRGLASKLAARLSLGVRIRREDLLAALYRRSEGADAAFPNSSGALDRIALFTLRRAGLVRAASPGDLALTEAGMAEGSRIIRSHRLWETFLSERVGLEPDHVHDPSHRMEHFMTDEMVSELAKDFKGRSDPHGKPVP